MNNSDTNYLPYDLLKEAITDFRKQVAAANSGSTSNTQTALILLLDEWLNEMENESSMNALETSAYVAKLSQVLSKVFDTMHSRFHTPIKRVARHNRNQRRLPKGTRTPEKYYQLPIVTALKKRGGKGRVKDILADVEKMVRSDLRKIDFTPLPSAPKNGPRWRNTAQWARNTMVKKGLLKSTSPRGIWELSKAGRSTRGLVS